MTPEQIASLVVVVVGGACVIASYAMLAQTSAGDRGYIDSPLWLDAGRDTVIALVALQALAAVGFLAAVGTWIFGKPPTGGLMARPAALPVTLAVFMVFSALWAFFLAWGAAFKGVVALTLIAVALASVALLAGAAEETKPRWWVVLGLLLLSTTTVLSDAVAWNSRFLASK